MRKISAKGSHTPIMLVNISILFRIIRPTRKKSMPTTNNRNVRAVMIGRVYPNLRWYIADKIPNPIGPRIKWMISVLFIVVSSGPIAIMAAQNAQPINAWIRMMSAFFIVVVRCLLK
jgi:hypothetical protein